MSINNHILNYYEQMVAEEILSRIAKVKPNATVDFMADVACVALNKLPPRYIRHKVDMAFYMSPDELLQTRQRVTEAVTDALVFVSHHHRVEES